MDLLDNYVRERWYKPVLARWLSQDPIGFAADDVNLYRYVRNNPIILIDPSGLACMLAAASSAEWRRCIQKAERDLIHCNKEVLKYTATCLVACLFPCTWAPPLCLPCLLACFIIGVGGGTFCRVRYQRRITECGPEPSKVPPPGHFACNC